jgi:undecaprenyl-diphosphatase
VFAALAALLAALVIGVSDSAAVRGVDGRAAAVVHEEALEGDPDWSLIVTNLGNDDFLAVLAAMAALALLASRRYRAALTVGLGLILAEVAVAILKAQVERPRPPGTALTEAEGFSFPSGHSAASIALYGTLALLVTSSVRWPARHATVIAAVSLITAVGATRVYLGVHYPTDVLAGWVIGALSALLAWQVAGRLSASRWAISNGWSG